LASKRHYVDEFVFDGDTLTYSNFSGGYFDRDHKVHYIHSDYQGSTIMVTDSVGNIEQHTAYYPYGEPQREPTGQPWLFSGKERERTASLRDYDFSARRHVASICSWLAPDPFAPDFVCFSPFSNCASNPIRYTDPTGSVIIDKEGIINNYKKFINEQIENLSKLKTEGIDKLISFYKGQLSKIKTLEQSDVKYSFIKTDGIFGDLIYNSI
jgi:RHS repeat-associated protein